jgi:hypothetical protein
MKATIADSQDVVTVPVRMALYVAAVRVGGAIYVNRPSSII